MDERRPWAPERHIKAQEHGAEISTKQISAERKRGHSATVMKAHLLRISLRLKPKRGSRPADVSLNPGPAGTDPTWNLDKESPG
jgi:hypothetical protein